MEKKFENEFVNTFIKIVIKVLKYCYLALAITTAGFLISFISIVVIKHENIDVGILTSIGEYLTSYSSIELIGMLKELGLVKYSIGVIGYGFAIMITYALIYLIFNGFDKMFKNVVENKIFTKENVNTINYLLPLSLFATFTQPIMVFVIKGSIGMFSETDINVNGIIFFIVLYILKLIIEEGYKKEKSSVKKLIKKIDDKIAEIEKKDKEKKSTDKKEKEEPKKEEAPKKKRTYYTNKKPKTGTTKK